MRTLLAVFAIAFAGGWAPLPPPYSADCSTVDPLAVNFHVDDFSYPVWSDGTMTVRVSRSRHTLTIRTNPAAEGIVILGTSRMRTIDRAGTIYRVRLGHDVPQSVIVCYAGS